MTDALIGIIVFALVFMAVASIAALFGMAFGPGELGVLIVVALALTFVVMRAVRSGARGAP